MRSERWRCSPTAVFRSGQAFRPGKARRGAILRASSLFEGASDEALEEVAGHLEPFGAAKGEAIFEEGDLGEALFIVASGEVSLLVATRGGQEVAAQLGAGDLFGSCALIRVGDHRRYTALAQTRVTGVRMGQAGWAALGEHGDATGSALRVALIRALVAQLDCANETLAATPGPKAARRS